MEIFLHEPNAILRKFVRHSNPEPFALRRARRIKKNEKQKIAKDAEPKYIHII